jgi:calcium/calmodulin-dependent protein kinase I
MQAILDADFSFTPEEYWRGVTEPARDFIRRCLTTDPSRRLTAHQALDHPWIREERASAGGADLLPNVRRNFNARVKLHAAIDTIRAINQLRAGQGAAKVMDGAKSREPVKAAPVPHPHAKPASEGEGMEGVEGQGQLGQGERMDVG